MLESKFQGKLIKEIKELLPGCVVLKNDPTYIQGIPDLLILHNDKWAALECKQCLGARQQPNQVYWADKLNKMSMARFIYPGNKEEILNELQQSLSTRRPTRVPKCK